MGIIFSNLRAERFAGFDNAGDLNFSEINIFIGPNSAGKSSLLHIPLILKQTFDDINPENRLITDGKLVGMGSFGDVIYGHNEKQTIRLGLTFGPQALPRHSMITALLSNLARDSKDQLFFDSFDLEFGSTSRAKRTYIKRFKFFRGTEDVLLEGVSSPTGKVRNWRSPFVESERGIEIGFHHFAPLVTLTARQAAVPSPPRLQQFYGSTWDFTQICQKAFSSIVHLQPIRTPIRAADRVTGESPISVGGTGENLLGVLYRDEKRGKNKRRLLAHLNHWLDKRFNLVKEVHIEPLTKSGSLYALTGRDSRSNFYVNLAAVGFGVSQVAPIIVQGFLSPENTALIIEQPEIHLHPAAQAELGDLFVQFAQQGKQLFIETHSQYLLFRIQRRIAEGSLSADKVRVFFINRGETGSNAKRLLLDERGRILDWPPGFFEEGYAETAAIAEALTQ